MNWGDIPQEMQDATAQLRQAQANLEKMVHAEIQRQVNLHCAAWRAKVAKLCRERETIRKGLEAAEIHTAGYDDSLPEVKEALAVLRKNDAHWFTGISCAQYAAMLENS